MRRKNKKDQIDKMKKKKYGMEGVSWVNGKNQV